MQSDRIGRAIVFHKLYRVIIPNEGEEELHVHYLMCLSANYAHIRDQEKFLQFQDLQMLSDNDMLTGKDRF
ncbi:hypothetical protein NQ318_017710 [Aromia moschata]|uniref:Uncharacterized protein n=1 Tax=Aromia moschata TaxID=1265417 RepID=A0AAV8XZQ3_9CUCU|nr:hypothetical protein NQ318_017710 [Aromia moschata]